MDIMMHHVQCMMWHNLISTKLRSYQSPFCRCWFVWDKGRLCACFWISSQYLEWNCPGIEMSWYRKKDSKMLSHLQPQHFRVVSHNFAFTKLQRSHYFDRKDLFVENVGHMMFIPQPLHQSFLEAFLSARHCQRNLRSKGRGFAGGWVLRGSCFESCAFWVNEAVDDSLSKGIHREPPG